MRSSRLAALAFATLTAACSDSNSPETQALIDYLLNYCDSPPAFVAIQTASGGTWTPVTLDATGKATVKLGDKFGLAAVYQNGLTGYSTTFYFATKAELPPSSATCTAPTGSKTLNGSIATLSSGQEAQVTMDGRNAYLFQGGATTFQLIGITNGAKDLLAQRRVSNTALADKVIIRRAQDLTTGSTMSQLNFGGTEAVNPASATVTITGVTTGELKETYSTLSTPNGLFAFFNSPPAGASSGTVYGLPSASGAATDIYTISLSVHNSDYTQMHGVDVFKKTFGDVAATAGAALSTPTVTSVSSSPKRLRLQLASQADYGKAIEFYYWQLANSVYHDMTIFATAAYFGSMPATWDLQPEVLTGLTGYPAAAEFGSATANWQVSAFGTTDFFFKDATDMADGTVHKWAYHESSTALLRAGDALVQSPSSASKREAMRRALLGGLPPR